MAAPRLQPPSAAVHLPDHQCATSDDDVTCSTPYVSAPSSPGRPTGGGFFYSAPASPMHFLLTAAAAASSAVPSPSDASSTGTSGSFEFEFSARFNADVTALPTSASAAMMSSADELFVNGQIRPMKLSAHLQRPQVLAPLLDDENEDDGDQNDDVFRRGRDLRLRDRSVRRRTRSLSPMRNTTPFEWCSDAEVPAKEERVTDETKKELVDENGGDKDQASIETTPSCSATSSRCSSAGRSSKRWVFLKDFLRSKSEGRNNVKFWHNISFSPIKDKKISNPNSNQSNSCESQSKENLKKQRGKKSAVNGAAMAPGKRRAVASAHERHYAANRAQAEEMRKRTFLPYKQGLLGCLGFNSKSYGAINGFARALNPVSSR